MDELIAIFGLFGGIFLLILGGLALLVPLIIFLGYGELRRIRKATESIEEYDLEAIQQSLARIEQVDLRIIRDYMKSIASDQDNSTNKTN